MNKKSTSWHSPILILTILLAPTILLIQKKALNSPILFFILLLAFIAWAISK